LGDKKCTALEEVDAPQRGILGKVKKKWTKVRQRKVEADII